MFFVCDLQLENLCFRQAGGVLIADLIHEIK